MISFEEVKYYLPKYLTPESEKALFQELQSFPDNIDSRLFTSYLKEEPFLFQGDGIEGLLFVNLPDSDIRKLRAVVLSNTCDINPKNKRLSRPNIVYSPILKLEKYVKNLLDKGLIEKEALRDHIDSLKKQRVTSIFYLPKGGSLESESMVFFDKVVSCDSNYLSETDIKSNRLFTLSNYGLYLFVLKLSIHFSRINEGLDRNSDLRSA
jgi:hypothetical protein